MTEELDNKVMKMFSSMQKSTIGIDENEGEESGDGLDVFDIDLIKDREMIEHEKGTGQRADLQDVLDDASVTRKHLIKLSAQCQEATDTALKMAQVAPNPEYLKVVSQLLGKSMTIGEKLLKMHEKTLQIERMMREGQKPSNSGGKEDAEEYPKPKAVKGTLADVIDAGSRMK